MLITNTAFSQGETKKEMEQNNPLLRGNKHTGKHHFKGNSKSRFFEVVLKGSDRFFTQNLPCKKWVNVPKSGLTAKG